MDPDFVERRRVGLENFLQRVTSHPVLSNDNILYQFLTEADSRLRALSATFRICSSRRCSRASLCSGASWPNSLLVIPFREKVLTLWEHKGEHG
ncbi:hypothetical protein CRUP_031450 [Coryphaenoides rupestris]|nr:hypothetical protein CRUP_031450 [Coryphaenoides rupestris]